jgi:hypothetical protein
MKGNKYKQIHVIRILSTNDYGKWYYTKQGRLFDATLEYIGQKSYYVIDELHKIPTEYANVVEIKKVLKYAKL